MKILVVYDGTVHAKRALRYGISQCAEKGGEVMLLSVFDRGLFVDYEAGLAAEDRARQEFLLRVQEAKTLVQEERTLVNVRYITADGDPDTIAAQLAGSEGADLILAPPRSKGLVKTSPVPVQVIPGTILIPVDNACAAPGTVEYVAREAIATASEGVVLGIVPVHIYSSSEKKELAAVKKRTADCVRRTKKLIHERGIPVTDAIRAGFPDEEILKAADIHDASLIILPAGSAVPSELSKAASVLLDEPHRLRRTLFLVPAETTA